ncbi:metal ABC transporter permease [Desulfurococcaceae archaeon MEX13E-LK6-19]|nr:metal ABC transporter permease [Desulfurococcaceae archaeon MEX13E-LK6-19]
MVERIGTLVIVNSIVVLIALAIILSIFIDPRWVIVMVSASITFGVLAPVVAVRRLYFLAGAVPHSALLAVVIAIPLARILGLLDEYFWSIIIGTLLIYCVGYAIYRGVDADTATAVFVALTASLSVIVLYYVLTSYPLQTSIWAFIVGDPLLVSWKDVYIALTVSVIVFIVVVLTYREHVVIGIDKDCVRLAGIKVKFYDWILFTVLGIATITMLKIIGFVLEHVFILLPAAIATTSSESSFNAFLVSLAVSMFAALTGLYVTVVTGFAPAGITGLMLFSVYLGVLVMKKIRG